MATLHIVRSCLIFILPAVPQDHRTPSYTKFFKAGLVGTEGGIPSIFIGGGAMDPNRPTVTAADKAFTILTDLNGKLRVPERCITVYPEGMDERDVLEMMVPAVMNYQVVKIFCPETHWALVRFYAWILFEDRAVVTALPSPEIPERHPGRQRIELLKRIPHTLIGMLSSCKGFGFIRDLELWWQHRRQKRKVTTPQQLRSAS